MTVVAAMGQMFYSLSIGMGILFTYGSYMKREIDMEQSITQVEIMDTLIAFLAGLMIIPAVFAFSGGNPDTLNAGPSLMFITIPKIFGQMPMGQIFAVIFFLSVVFAGITSLINMFEAVIESIQHRFEVPRKLAVLLCGIICFVVGVFLEAEPSVGKWMDFITILVVPFGAVLGAVSVYYVLGYKEIRKELEQGRTKSMPSLFGKIACGIYVPLTIIVFVLGIIYKGIG